MTKDVVVKPGEDNLDDAKKAALGDEEEPVKASESTITLNKTEMETEVGADENALDEDVV